MTVNVKPQETISNTGGRELVIVVLNWNGFADTCGCLDSLAASSFLDFRVVVVDNGSSENEAGRLQERYPQIRVIGLGRNRGFAEGSNIGIADGLHDPACRFILLLNNDTIVPGNALKILVSTARESPRTLVGPVILMRDGTMVQTLGGTIWRFLGGTTNIGSGWARKDVTVDVAPDFLSGCAVLGPRAFFEEVGGFATEYFAYYEDAELGMTANQLGYEQRVCHQATIVHRHSMAVQRQPGMRTYLLMRNTILFARRNLGLPARVCFIVNGILLRLIVGLFENRSVGFIPHWLRGLRDGFSGGLEPIRTRTP